VKGTSGILDDQTMGRLERWRNARALFVRPDGSEAERAVAQAFGRQWSRAPVYGRARRLLIERGAGTFLARLHEALGAVAGRVRVAPEDPMQTKWDAMGNLRPLAQARREVGALWLCEVVRTGEFFVEFQPIVDLSSGNTLGYEGLLRARSGSDVRAAGEIFPAAEALRVERGFERLSWSCVLEGARRLPPEAQIFLNVNPRLIEPSGEGLSALGREAERLDFPYSRIVLDLVEVEKLDSIDHLPPSLTVPRDLGVTIALDNVTSGYGTLRYCEGLQPEWVKVDGEVTRGIGRDPRRRAILRFLVELSRDFGCGLIAEKIEDAEDLDVCAAEGVRAAQGYFVAHPAMTPPAPSEAFHSWFASRPRSGRLGSAP
jgi:EAL domain-containing protein (putative c-di-GMP-specific phosphodiesterase class I)